jgi:hypothetical protein
MMMQQKNRSKVSLAQKMHDGSLSWLGTGTSIKSGGVKQCFSALISPLSDHASVFHMSLKYQPGAS